MVAPNGHKEDCHYYTIVHVKKGWQNRKEKAYFTMALRLRVRLLLLYTGIGEEEQEEEGRDYGFL